MFFKKVYLPVQLFFIFICSLVLIAKSYLLNWGIDYKVVVAGNILLLLVTLLSLYLYQRAMIHPSTSGFLRNTFGSIMLKLLICVVAVLIYVLTVGDALNKGGLLVCVFLYLAYAILEMKSLLSWNKARKNA
jgi:hypothetical protein